MTSDGGKNTDVQSTTNNYRRWRNTAPACYAAASHLTVLGFTSLLAHWVVNTSGTCGCSNVRASRLRLQPLSSNLSSTLRREYYNAFYSSFITVVASSGKRNATVWRPSVCLSRRHTDRDSLGGSMRRGQRTFWPDSKKLLC